MVFPSIRLFLLPCRVPNSLKREKKPVRLRFPQLSVQSHFFCAERSKIISDAPKTCPHRRRQEKTSIFRILNIYKRDYTQIYVVKCRRMFWQNFRREELGRNGLLWCRLILSCIPLTNLMKTFSQGDTGLPSQ